MNNDYTKKLDAKAEEVYLDPITRFSYLKRLIGLRVSRFTDCELKTQRFSALRKERAMQLLCKELDVLQADLLWQHRLRATAEDTAFIDAIIELLNTQIKTVVSAFENVEQSPFMTEADALLHEAPDGAITILSPDLVRLWREADNEGAQAIAEHHQWVCTFSGLTQAQVEETISKCTPEGYAISEEKQQ